MDQQEREEAMEPVMQMRQNGWVEEAAELEELVLTLLDTQKKYRDAPSDVHPSLSGVQKPILVSAEIYRSRLRDTQDEIYLFQVRSKAAFQKEQGTAWFEGTRPPWVLQRDAENAHQYGRVDFIQASHWYEVALEKVQICLDRIARCNTSSDIRQRFEGVLQTDKVKLLCNLAIAQTKMAALTGIIFIDRPLVDPVPDDLRCTTGQYSMAPEGFPFFLKVIDENGPPTPPHHLEALQRRDLIPPASCYPEWQFQIQCWGQIARASTEALAIDAACIKALFRRANAFHEVALLKHPRPLWETAPECQRGMLRSFGRPQGLPDPASLAEYALADIDAALSFESSGSKRAACLKLKQQLELVRSSQPWRFRPKAILD
jgi:hypothetical protein